MRNFKEQQVHDMIPRGILNHYAEQQRMTTLGVCGMLLLQYPDWADRVLSDDSLFSFHDVTHDFIGLWAKDEFFVPRI